MRMAPNRVAIGASHSSLGPNVETSPTSQSSNGLTTMTLTRIRTQAGCRQDRMSATTRGFSGTGEVVHETITQTWCG